MKINLFIPTLNAGPLWEKVIESIRLQSISFHRKVIIDSGSTDGTLRTPLVNGFDIIHIDKNNFDHGGTRQMAVETYPDADIFLFLTQDAILANESSVENLVKMLENNPRLGLAYGRQLPHKHAKALEAHARLFSYPDHSVIRRLEDADRFKIRTISCSNSFAAYRKTAFFEAGGFPDGVIMGEDVIIAGKMLLKNWHSAYVAEAQVYHSHDYTIKEEFKRYFDIGVFHAGHQWIFEKFGRAEGEGLKYLKSELSYLQKHDATLIPKALITLFAKLLGYKTGLAHKYLPRRLKGSFSMHSRFWNVRT